MKGRRDEKREFITGRIQDWRDSGLEGYMKRRDLGLE